MTTSETGGIQIDQHASCRNCARLGYDHSAQSHADTAEGAYRGTCLEVIVEALIPEDVTEFCPCEAMETYDEMESGLGLSACFDGGCDDRDDHDDVTGWPV